MKANLPMQSGIESTFFTEESEGEKVNKEVAQ